MIYGDFRRLKATLGPRVGLERVDKYKKKTFLCTVLQLFVSVAGDFTSSGTKSDLIEKIMPRKPHFCAQIIGY